MIAREAWQQRSPKHEPWKIECFLEDLFLGSQWSIILGVIDGYLSNANRFSFRVMRVWPAVAKGKRKDKNRLHWDSRLLTPTCLIGKCPRPCLNLAWLIGKCLVCFNLAWLNLQALAYCYFCMPIINTRLICK